ncbi:peptide-methionine (R)-S-oxide reductase MsrB [Pedobacter cryoconitis]|uniref:peptide-methionine (R)-S-oxide reductase n=1 Tax=Pedobacter cryoconitis TaxID=188932 RepID=A0A7X0MIN6_9SPHI|nr:peptide-methionine (R)-S-oxide reductase MsrB [Pedobacter cryoconitis]MBB6498740.1 methionine-R-sulfoxide reductase [Pedobacter cryoconitis]
MKQTVSIAVIALMSLSACAQQPAPKKYPITKTNTEWKKILSPTAYQIMVMRGTETPYKNAYYNNHQKGIYVSAATGEPLFSSDDKYDSGTGWPSFTKPINKDAVEVVKDNSDGMSRDEIVEKKTGLHLGHVFDDGPADRGGLRYCMNSGAFKFIKK